MSSNVNYHVHKTIPLDVIVSQFNPFLASKYDLYPTSAKPVMQQLHIMNSVASGGATKQCLGKLSGGRAIVFVDNFRQVVPVIRSDKEELIQ